MLNNLNSLRYAQCFVLCIAYFYPLISFAEAAPPRVDNALDSVKAELETEIETEIDTEIEPCTPDMDLEGMDACDYQLIDTVDQKTEDAAVEEAVDAWLEKDTEIVPHRWKRSRMQRKLKIDYRVIGYYDEISEDFQAHPGYFSELAGAPSWLIIGGEHRTRYEYMNGQFRRGLRSVDQQLSHRTRVMFAIKDILDPLRFTVELQDSRVNLTEEDSNVSANHINKTDIQQLHLDFHFDHFFGLDLPTEIQFGRVNMDLGRGRWIARNNFRNTTNSYDGVYWTIGESQDSFRTQSFAVWPVDKDMEKLDSVLDENESSMWGTYLLLPPIDSLPWLRAELNYIGHSNSNGDRDFNMYGYRVFKPSRIEEIGFEIESQYQAGYGEQDKRFAHFHHAEIDYTFATDWRPELQFKFDYATPDFDTLYGRRSFEFTPTGIIGPFQRSNLISGGYRLLVHPDERFQVFFQHRATWLADKEQSWVNTGLADPSGNSGDFLGHTYEVRAQWMVQKNIILQAGYFHFNFGDFPRNAPNSPVDRDTHYGFFQTEFIF